MWGPLYENTNRAWFHKKSSFEAGDFVVQKTNLNKVLIKGSLENKVEPQRR